MEVICGACATNLPSGQYSAFKQTSWRSNNWVMDNKKLSGPSHTLICFYWPFSDNWLFSLPLLWNRNEELSSSVLFHTVLVFCFNLHDLRKSRSQWFKCLIRTNNQQTDNSAQFCWVYVSSKQHNRFSLFLLSRVFGDITWNWIVNIAPSPCIWMVCTK